MGVAALSVALSQGMLEAQEGAVAELRAGEQGEYDGMEFVWVPAGEFLMGSESAEAFERESPVREVRISAGYWLGKHEVTQGEWEAVMGSNPSRFQNCGRDCPVEQVTWEDAQAFIGRLNGGSGGNRYRLPSEAEWENSQSNWCMDRG